MDANPLENVKGSNHLPQVQIVDQQLRTRAWAHMNQEAFVIIYEQELGKKIGEEKE